VSTDRLLAAALALRVTADTTGLEADLASKLTRAERVAVESAGRTSAAVGKIAGASHDVAVKAEATTLRASAAQETYNRLLRAGEQDTVRLAKAQASALTTQATAERQQAALFAGRSPAATAAGGGLLGGARSIIGFAAGAGAFTAVKQGVTTFNELGNAVRSYQRATGDSAESSSKMVEILNRFGIEGDAATQSVLRLGRNIEDTPDKLTKYGVAIARGKDGTVDLTNTILNANDAFHRTPDAATRAALVLDLFGRGGQKLLPILSANREQLEEFVESARKSGRIFTQDQLSQAFAFQQASHDIHDAWAGVEIALAKGVVPALTTVSHVGTHVFDFLSGSGPLSEGARDIGKVVLGLTALNYGIKAIDAIRGSALFTKIFNVTGTQAAAAANVELAASYRAVGAAAASAIPAVVGLTTAEAAGGAIGAGMAAGLGGGAAFGLASRLATPVGVGSILPAAIAGFGSYKGASYLLNHTPVGAPVRGLAEGIGGLFGGHYNHDLAVQSRNLLNPAGQDLVNQYGSVNKAIEALRQQNAERKTEQTAATNTQLSQAALGYTSSLDIFSGAPRIGPDPAAVSAARSAALHAQIEAGIDAKRLAALQAGHPASQASILSAEKALDRARDHGSTRDIAIAEARLNHLRSGGKATTVQLAQAEETLRRAKEKSATATKTLHDTERGGLQTASEVLRNIASRRAYEQGNAVAVAKLVRQRLNPQTIAALEAQDKKTPGELKEFARTETPSLLNEINKQVRAENKAAELIEAATGTDQEWRAIGRQKADALLDGIRERIFLNTPNGGIKPTRRTRQIDSDRRLRSLGSGFKATT
jgi:hypothetical protein